MIISEIVRDINECNISSIKNEMEFAVMIKHLSNNRTRLRIDDDKLKEYTIKNVMNLIELEKLKNSACFFKLLYDMNIENSYIFSFLLTTFLEDEHQGRKILNLPISKEMKDFISSLRFIESCFDLLHFNYSGVNSEMYFELLFRYGDQIDSSLELDVEECFKALTNTLKKLEKQNLFFKHKLLIQGRETSLCGYVFYKLSYFNGHTNRIISNGVSNLISFLHITDSNFYESFEKFYSEKGSTLKKICLDGECVNILFEDYDLNDEKEDEYYESDDSDIL